MKDLMVRALIVGALMSSVLPVCTACDINELKELQEAAGVAKGHTVSMDEFLQLLRKLKTDQEELYKIRRFLVEEKRQYHPPDLDRPDGTLNAIKEHWQDKIPQ